MNDTDIIKSERKKECPVCGSSGKYIYQNLKDRLFGQSEGWNLRKCSNTRCKLFWLDPMPTRDEIWKAYDSYYTHSEQKSSFFYNDQLAKCYLSLKYGYYTEYGFFQKLLGYVVFLHPLLKAEADFKIFYLHNKQKGKILDYGCGNGWLLSNLKHLGWETYGMDFDDKAVEYCNSKGLNVTRPDMSRYPDSFFDAITINHVIEHVHDFKLLIEQCYRKLKVGGELVIATPNTGSRLSRYYNKHWMQLDPPRHLQLFNLKNLSDVVEKANFKIEKSGSSIRIDVWTTVVSRSIRKYGQYIQGTKKRMDVLLGLINQLITYFISVFDRGAGDEIIIKAVK